MNKSVSILIIILGVALFNACNKKQAKSRHTRNLYLETVNFTPELKTCFDDYFFNQRNFDTTWVIVDTVVLHYKDASTLPDKNLLDNTKKMRITLLEKDSIGNPAFSVEVFRTENSKWVRSSNSSNNPIRLDTLVSSDQLCDIITKSTYIYILKFNP